MKDKYSICFGLLAGLFILLFSQCSPYAGKNLLNFLFDGVPENDTLQIKEAEPGVAPSDSLALADNFSMAKKSSHVIHYPYEEGDCASCHNEALMGTLVEDQPGLCYLCHEDISANYNYLHGPVAGGYCTACHNPHKSESPKLLRMTGDQLCLHCHEKENVEKNEMHQDLEGMFCMDCHHPHGGEDKYIFQ